MLAIKRPVDPSPTALTLEVEAVAPEYALGTLGPVLLQLWQLGTPEDGAHKARALARSFRGRGYPHTSSLIVIPEASEFPSSAARQECAQIPKELFGCRGLTLVREGEGFRAAAVRAIMTGMMSLGQTIPYKIVGTVNEGCDWIGNLIPGVSAGDLFAAHRDLRSAWAKANHVTLKSK